MDCSLLARQRDGHVTDGSARGQILACPFGLHRRGRMFNRNYCTDTLLLLVWSNCVVIFVAQTQLINTSMEIKMLVGQILAFPCGFHRRGECTKITTRDLSDTTLLSSCVVSFVVCGDLPSIYCNYHAAMPQEANRCVSKVNSPTNLST
jgi:hypothetical protein